MGTGLWRRLNYNNNFLRFYGHAHWRGAVFVLTNHADDGGAGRDDTTLYTFYLCVLKKQPKVPHLTGLPAM